MPRTSAGCAPDFFSAAFIAVQHAFQMSSEDCSTKSGFGRHIRMGWLACASIRPAAVKRPARALPVPTSIPTNKGARFMTVYSSSIDAVARKSTISVSA